MTASTFPDDRSYSSDHEWVAWLSSDLPAEPVRVGITRVATDNLGDLVYLDLPEVGTDITAGQACGEVESTKTVSDLVAPVTGSIVELNSAVADDPTVVSTDPYGAGWLFTVRVTGLGPLLTAAEYAEENGVDA